MAYILNIETATPLCSVALAQNGKVIAHRETMEEKSHASRLTSFISELLKTENISVADLDAVAVGKGPGSYTGLRIGVSAAKGLCYGAGIPLIAVNTLRILYQNARLANVSDANPGTLFCPMIDARRMEVYTCIFDENGFEVEPVNAKIIESTTFNSILENHRIFFFGSGMEKCKNIISHPNARFLEGVYPHAAALANIAEQSYQHKEFENVAYFEPFYLKDFIATVSKKGLHF